MAQKKIFSGLSRAAAVSVLTLSLATGSRAAGREKVLHAFLDKPGKYPVAGLIFDASGNLYGITAESNSRTCKDYDGCGIVFRLTPTSTGWSYGVLHVFKNGEDGAGPDGTLVFDSAGNLYGTTASGGTSCECGTVFELTPTSGGNWTESVIYSFHGGSDGAAPVGGVTFDRSGNLYGTTINGGTGCSFSCGTVFELSPHSGGGWVEKILYNFQGVLGNPDGAYPDSALTIDASGNLYGTTSGGGAGDCSGSSGGCGTVFEVSPIAGGGWTERVLHRFQGGSDGQGPSGVVFDSSGDLYGSTSQGGSKSGCGMVFELTPHSDGNWAESILERFSCGREGGYPNGITLDAAGNIYGATAGNGGTMEGTIFKLAPVSGGKGRFSLLYTFTGNRDGGSPDSTLILDSTGHLYGMTFYGGHGSEYNGFGVVFEITP